MKTPLKLVHGGKVDQPPMTIDEQTQRNMKYWTGEMEPPQPSPLTMARMWFAFFGASGNPFKLVNKENSENQ